GGKQIIQDRAVEVKSKNAVPTGTTTTTTTETPGTAGAGEVKESDQAALPSDVAFTVALQRLNDLLADPKAALDAKAAGWATLKAADDAMAALPHRITGLYLRKGSGIEKVLAQAPFLMEKITQLRGEAGRALLEGRPIESQLGMDGKSLLDADKAGQVMLKI